MNRLTVLCSCAVLVATTSLLSSCDGGTAASSPPEVAPKGAPSIVGTWHSAEGSIEVAFHADGTGTNKAFRNGSAAFLRGFRYEMPSEGNLRIIEDKSTETALMKFWLSADGTTLTVVSETSDTTTFARGPLPPSAIPVDTTTIPWNTSITYGNLHDGRDGKNYRTVKIGSQTWMAEDLAFDTLGARWDAMADAWGYPWSLAMGIESRYDSAEWTSTERRKGVCPAGWHLPSLQEWKTLIANAGGDSSAGTALKSTADWHDNGNGVDRFGFRVLSASEHYDDQDHLLGSSTLYWTSTATGAVTSSWIAGFYSWRSAVGLEYGSRESGFHVRCLQD